MALLWVYYTEIPLKYFFLKNIEIGSIDQEKYQAICNNICHRFTSLLRIDLTVLGQLTTKQQNLDLSALWIDKHSSHWFSLICFRIWLILSPWRQFFIKLTLAKINSRTNSDHREIEPDTLLALCLHNACEDLMWFYNHFRTDLAKVAL